MHSQPASGSKGISLIRSSFDLVSQRACAGSGSHWTLEAIGNYSRAGRVASTEAGGWSKSVDAEPFCRTQNCGVDNVVSVVRKNGFLIVEAATLTPVEQIELGPEPVQVGAKAIEWEPS